MRVGENSDDEVDDVASALAEDLSAEVVSQIGSTAILVRFKPRGSSALWPMLDAQDGGGAATGGVRQQRPS